MAHKDKKEVSMRENYEEFNRQFYSDIKHVERLFVIETMYASLIEE
jgi:hypothetical protein